jgi:hypothetical protein
MAAKGSGHFAKLTSPEQWRERAGTCLQRLRDTSLQFLCCFSASSNSCMAITFPAFRWNR